MSDSRPAAPGNPRASTQAGAQTQQTFSESAGSPENNAASQDAADAANTPAGAPRAPHAFSLKISTAKNGAPLGKAQKTFNRLITQIENLRNKITRERHRLDNALLFHVQILHPLQRQIAGCRKQIVIFAHTQLKTAHRAFSNKQRHILRIFISEQLDMIASVEGGLAGEKLQAIYTDIEGMTPGEARKRQLDAERAEIEEEMENLGLDIDLSAFNKDGMTPDEFLRATASVMEQFRKAGISEDDIPPIFRQFPGADPAAAGSENTAAPGKPRKKTKKQLEREAREKAIEEARARNLSGVYKQLARVLHPDLEQDSVRKKQKEALMQQLTVAYRANDMHTLLRLELEWLQHGEQDIERLSEEKLVIYNEVLREQVTALRNEQQTLAHDVRYAPLRPYAKGPFGSLSTFNGPKEEKELRETLEAISALDTSATGTGVIKKLKAILRDFEAEMVRSARERTIDDIMAGMMEEVMEEVMDDMRFPHPRRGRRPPHW